MTCFRKASKMGFQIEVNSVRQDGTLLLFMVIDHQILAPTYKLFMIGIINNLKVYKSLRLGVKMDSKCCKTPYLKVKTIPQKIYTSFSVRTCHLALTA